ncbi:protein NUCLEAR FUSION DEFECTIVE 4-like [Juglans microcarpa x Juglans regia]|uniref:protein NUCLEAR FUSION DEFECTIVE 4-like n=1 Tax=Juglans microcarpa x Juglans regia TaxID=2249226 RepID=UPI001B7F6B0B|nr:protein NUCLEAR FUSION DEFECTIVE 4-like [Juglans microcarpa x Juglans regia]
MERLLMSSKWIATVASIWIQCSVDAYTFSIYSSVLKSSQGYDQSMLDMVSVYKDIGGNAGVLSGVLFSAVAVGNSNRSGTVRSRSFAGPWVVHLAGAIQNFLGYLLMWASVVEVIHRPPVPLMCFFVFLSAHAQTFFSTTNMVCGVKNFAECGGTIVGIMKGFLGISGAIVIQGYETFCKNKSSTFLLMLALLPTFVSLALMFLVRIYEDADTTDDRKQLNGFSAVALIVAGYLMIIISLENIFTLPSWAHIFTFILLLLLLASPLGISIKAQREEDYNKIRSLKKVSVESNPLMKSSKSSAAKDPLAYQELPGGEGDQVNHATLDDIINLPEEEGMNLLQAMSTLNFWLLFAAMVCGMGTAQAVANNLSQIGESFNYTRVEISNLVSLWGIWNFVGRIGAGNLSDYLLHTRGCGRPFLMGITLASMAAGHAVIASGFPGILYVGSILVGICYGSQWALMPTIAFEMFGVRHVGTIFNAIGIANPVGSYIFSVRIIGYIYDMEAGGEDNFCFGTHCFMLSFLIMSFVAFLGFLVAIALFFRTKQIYQLLVLRRLNHSLR